jgi:hypothetical protein
MWATSESQSEAVHTDAMVKWKSLSIPEEVIWEELGLSPRQIERIKQLLAAEPVTPAPTEPAEPAPDDTQGQEALATGGA